LNIELCRKEVISKASLFNSVGQFIQEIDDSVIDMSTLDSGVYYLTFFADRKRYLKKVVKI